MMHFLKKIFNLFFLKIVFYSQFVAHISFLLCIALQTLQFFVCKGFGQTWPNFQHSKNDSMFQVLNDDGGRLLQP